MTATIRESLDSNSVSVVTTRVASLAQLSRKNSEISRLSSRSTAALTKHNIVLRAQHGSMARARSQKVAGESDSFCASRGHQAAVSS